MRVVVTLTVLAFVVPAGGSSLAASTARVTLPPPPKCSVAATQRTATLVVPGGAYHSPLYIRYCGPARGAIDLNGRSYSIHGGFCQLGREGQGTLVFVRIGLATDKPAAPGRDIMLKLPAQPGRITITDSDFELPTMGDVAGVGTVILHTGLKGGTFTLGGRGETGRIGVHFTGSWACRVLKRK